MASYAYTLGNAGNRTNATELSGRSLVYGYDNDYRLMSETITSDPGGNNGAENYTYDAVGNRQTLTSTIPSLPGSMSYSYDANDRLTTDIYDNDGNTTSSGGTANTYDFENRMLTHGTVSIVYDGDGNRVSETVGSTTTKYLVDDLNPTDLPQVLDEIVSGSVTRTYAYGLQRISETQLVSNTWAPSFYGYDGHGSTRFLTSTSGTATDSYDYDAFGMPVRTSGTTANSFLYSGERSDSSIGLYYLRARYYNQATGRLWARDPIEGGTCTPLSFNPYIYTLDDPIDRTDPTGLAVAAPPLPLPLPTAPPTPTQPQAQFGGVEYSLLIGFVSFSAIAGSEYLAEKINCAFQWVGTGVKAAVASNAAPIAGGPCLQKPKPKTCANTFPNAKRCDALPPDYKYNSAGQAIGAIGGYWGRPVGTKNEAGAEKGPCSVNGAGPLAGTHYSLMFLDNPKQKRPYAGSVGCCPCCDDSGGQPRLVQKCACLNVNHKPCPF